MNLCTLSPKVCKILPRSSKKKVHYFTILPSPLSLNPKALIVLSQQKHLLLYLNMMNLNKPPCTGELTVCEGCPLCINKSLWHVELHLKVEIYSRDVRMWTEWFQTKKHFVLKNVKPHWTVLYQVIKKRKTLRHLLELRPKKKNK